MANRKNRIENGKRAEFLGSNPHSKGDDFSRSITVRCPKIHEIRRTIVGIIKQNKNLIVTTFIN